MFDIITQRISRCQYGDLENMGGYRALYSKYSCNPDAEINPDAFVHKQTVKNGSPFFYEKGSLR